MPAPRSGDLWFATSKGAVVVNPAAILTHSRPPMLVLEHVRLDGQEVTNLHKLKLAYGDTVRSHLQHIYNKLRVRTRTEAVVKYLDRHGDARRIQVK